MINNNRNRAHAIQQIKKGVKAGSFVTPDENIGDVQLLAGIANALVYIGDIMKEQNEILKKNDELMDIVVDAKEVV